MTPVRTFRVRPVFLAALAAFCLLTFGGSAHSSPAFFTSGSNAAGQSAVAGVRPSVKAVPQTDAELVARTAASGVAGHVSLPNAELGAGIALAVSAAWLLLRRRRSEALTSSHRRPGLARAPPLAA